MGLVSLMFLILQTALETRHTHTHGGRRFQMREDGSRSEGVETSRGWKKEEAALGSHTYINVACQANRAL